MKITEYKGCEIHHFRPSTKTHFKIYKDEVFKHTSSKLKDARSRIDFCTKHGLWG